MTSHSTKFTGRRACQPHRAVALLLAGAACLAGALAPGAPGAASAAPEVLEPAPVPAAERIDLNVATAEQLESLPRIGPAIAQRILDYRRTVGGFGSVDELLNVRGIGERTLEILRPHVTVSARAEKSANADPAAGS